MTDEKLLHDEYVKPTIEIVEFSVEESIAASGASFASAICTETLFNWGE